MSARDQGLTTEIVDGRLVISIGIDVLRAAGLPPATLGAA